MARGKGASPAATRSLNSVHLICRDVNLSLTALLPEMLRVRAAQGRPFWPRRSWSFVAPDESFPALEFAVSHSDGKTRLATGILVAEIDEAAGQLSIRAPCENLVLQDDPFDGGPSWSGKTAAWKTCLPEAAHVYGLGDRTGLLDKAGRKYSFWTYDPFDQQGPSSDRMYKAIPFFLFLSDNGHSYGIFLNNTFQTSVELPQSANRSFRMEVSDGDLDYYVIYGPKPIDVIERYTRLTGRIPLPPRWALGYHQARWSYSDEAEVRQVAEEFRRRRIPADAIYLDIDYMESNRVFTWDPERFPEPQRLSRDLGEQGFRLVTLVNPGVQVRQGYPPFDEGNAHGYFIKTAPTPDAPLYRAFAWPGECVLPDFVRTDVREWWSKLCRALLRDGAAGILSDLNEPTLHDREYEDPEGKVVHPPLEAPHGNQQEPATHAEVHNLYGTLQALASREAMLEERPNDRPFAVTRAAGPGAQTVAATWTGDNTSSWEHLEMSLPQLMNLGISGLSFAGADIGGFLMNCSPELLIRWTQLGAFYPFARNNSALGTTRQEPWALGRTVEDACRKAIEFRYRLLPYLYTVFEESSRIGTPVFRPLFLQYPEDHATHEMHDQALIGSNLMIAPVLRPGQRKRLVYLPSGKWYDLTTHLGMSGPGYTVVGAELDAPMPLFARAGSIIPLGPVTQHAGDGALEPLTLLVFPNAEGRAKGSLYEDDGESLRFQAGEYRTTNFDYARGSNNSLLSADSVGCYTTAARTVRIEAYGENPCTAVITTHSADWSASI
jgi:alpha-glucosidase